jgi:AraC-like DNA-binding protein
MGSARQAQRLFAQSGGFLVFSSSGYRWRTGFWLGPRNRCRKISDIADSVGFGDLSYFNRAFRSRFGTPRTYASGRYRIEWISSSMSVTSRSRRATCPGLARLSPGHAGR